MRMQPNLRRLWIKEWRLKVELLREWMGHKRRAVLTLSDRTAQDLIDRKTARPYAPKKLGKKDVDKVNKGLG